MEKMRQISKIECTECERMLPAYIKNKLSIYDVDKVLYHVQTCSQCKEELTIQFLVTVGLRHVERSNDYNLIKLLEDKLASSERRIQRHLFSIHLSIAILSMILFLSIGSTAFLLFY